MENSNNPISSTVPSTVVLEGTVELIGGLCFDARSVVSGHGGKSMIYIV